MFKLRSAGYLRAAPIAMLLLVIASSGVSQVRKVAKGYLLRQKFVVGRTISYTFATEVSIPNSNASHVSGPVVMKVLSVSGNTAQVAASIGPFSLNGKVVAQLGEQQGAIVEVTNTGKIVGGGDHVQQLAVLFPTDPVMPGQDWRGQSKVNVYGNSESVLSHYRFVGMTTVDGHAVAHLRISLTGSGKTKLNGVGDTFVLASDGTLWQSKSKFTIQMAQMTLNATTTLARK